MLNKNNYKIQRRPEKEMIFGLRPVIEAIKAGKNIEKIFVRRDTSNQLVRELYDAVGESGIPLQKTPLEKLNHFTQKNHQGVVALLSPVEYQRIEDIVPLLYERGKIPFVVVLNGVTDVRNFGAIARTCECAGVDAIVVAASGNAPINADAVKTSVGALLKIPVCRTNNLKNAVRFLAESGLKLVAASEKAENEYTQTTYTEPVALILGSEEEGIQPEILNMCAAQVAIPVFGVIQSLNVSVAAGILIYEVIRQRN